MIDSASILITDDDTSFRDTLRGMLEPQGYRTLVASDGEEALRIVRLQEVHLLLIDMHMPKLTGLDVLRQVKQWKALLPCILMSANADEALVQQARLAQAFSVLSKSVGGRRFSITVRQALECTYAGRQPQDDQATAWQLPDHLPLPGDPRFAGSSPPGQASPPGGSPTGQTLPPGGSRLPELPRIPRRRPPT